MRHLRSTGIAISGSTQKRQLMNTGYFHGYKGYRFFQNSQKRLPVTSYEEIYATIQYDSALKALFYSKIMFIETAVKNIALERILVHAKAEGIGVMYDKVISGYRNAPVNSTSKQKKELQQKKLNLQNRIQADLARAYKEENPKITHFYNDPTYRDVPVWALFEILTMGELGNLLSCLTWTVRDDISRKLGLNLAVDTDRQLVYKYIYTLKDLRNAVAHNAVVFDTRFRPRGARGGGVTRAMQQCLIQEMGLPYVNFDSIGDYVLLMCYYLKLLHVFKAELKAFVREFEKITERYRQAVSRQVAAMVIHPDLGARMGVLKKFI